jgi:hypothetical protein
MGDIWTNFTNSIPEYATDAFSAVDPWFYPILFAGIIGFIYSSMNSVTTAIIGILITFGIFATTTSIFVDTPEVTQLLYIITVVGLTMLITTLVLNKRRR